MVAYPSSAACIRLYSVYWLLFVSYCMWAECSTYNVLLLLFLYYGINVILHKWKYLTLLRGRKQPFWKFSKEQSNYLWPTASAAAKLLPSCPTLCDPIDGSPPASRVPGILQARTLEWVATSFFNAWKWKVKVKSLNRVRLFTTPWTAAHQAPPSMGFSRQEYWSGVPLPSPNTIYIYIQGKRKFQH